MRILILASLMSMSFLAEASWFQIHCSNGEGTITTASGHDANYVTLTERVWNPDFSLSETTLTLDYFEVRVEDSDRMELAAGATSSCTSNSNFGMGTWFNISTMKTKIFKKDASLFAPSTVGVSLDQTYVEAYLICEEHGNSEMPCDSHPGKQE